MLTVEQRTIMPGRSRWFGVTRQEAYRLSGRDRKGLSASAPSGSRKVSELERVCVSVFLCLTHCAVLESLRECQFNSKGSLSLWSPGTC